MATPTPKPAVIEVRSFKWPRRPTSVAVAHFLGADDYGCWLGIRQGDPWWMADRSNAGLFEQSFVKLVPEETNWTACFNAADPLVDVDIVLPVCWGDGTLDEVDLELDILRVTNGNVYIRDQDEFERVQQEWAMPLALAAQAKVTCAEIYDQVRHDVEPFHSVGHRWLASFLESIDAAAQ